MNTELLPYRLKSARRKRRLLIKDRDKQLLKLDRERHHISRDPDYKRTVPLDEPYQKGWKRLFVLKPQIAKSDMAEFYQGILDAITSVQYHYDESFKKPRRKRRWHRYVFAEMPVIYMINSYDWKSNKNKFSPEQRECFVRVDHWDQAYYRWYTYYQFPDKGLFEIAVLPNMITTVKIGDALLEQRIAWIDDQFYKKGLKYRLDKLQKGNRYNGFKDGTEKKKYCNLLKNKPDWDWEEEY